MGANMARRIKDVGFSVAAVYDLRAENAKNLAQEIGAEACNRLARVTELCDVIFTVVTDDNAMRKIFGLGGKKGDNLLKNARGKFFVNCATISPKVHIEVEKAARKAGAASLEACMASSITQAREGTLYLMCGGNEGVFNRLRPMLERLSSSMRFIGPAGQAANVKAPLLVHLAEQDPRVNETYIAYEQELQKAGVQHQILLYRGTQHGFHNNSTPRYDEAAAKLSWERTIAFFKKNLA